MVGDRNRALLGKKEVVYNGVDASFFDPTPFIEKGRTVREKLGIAIDARVVSCIAGFRPQKGHRFLLDAMGRLEGVHLLLAGDGPLRGELEAMVGDMELGRRVHFLGNVADVRPVLAASDITVLASTAEAFSMAMLESMAMETPVVATDVGGLAEAILPGETGFLVPPGDGTALAEALDEALGDHKQLRRMGRQARRLALDRFTKAEMVRRTAEVLVAVGGCDGPAVV